jgi:hypothetical protein
MRLLLLAASLAAAAFLLLTIFALAVRKSVLQLRSRSSALEETQDSLPARLRAEKERQTPPDKPQSRLTAEAPPPSTPILIAQLDSCDTTADSSTIDDTEARR